MTANALATVLPKQRRPLLVAVLLTAGAIWLAAPVGRAGVGIFFGVGVFLSLLNHVLAEVALFRALESASELSRKQFALGSMARLGFITLIALTLVATFWPDGAAVLIGLALMHLVMLLFTGLPLLNEMRKA